MSLEASVSPSFHIKGGMRILSYKSAYIWLHRLGTVQLKDGVTMAVMEPLEL